MAAFPDQINNGPVVLASLEVGYIKLCGFSAAQPTTQQDREYRSISFALERVAIGRLPQGPGLLGGKPVAEANAYVFGTLHATNSGSQFRAEQAGISSFVRAGKYWDTNPAPCQSPPFG